MRGFGLTEIRKGGVAPYRMDQLVADVVSLLNVLGRSAFVRFQRLHMPAADPFAVHADGDAVAGKQACEGRPGELRALIGVEISQRSPPAVVPAIDLVATEVAYERVDWIPTDGTKITDAL